MCDIKTVLIVAALLIAATGFCINHVNLSKKLGHHSEIKSESPCEKGYRKYCLSVGECCYLLDQDAVACNCICLCGGKCCEKYMWWT